ncbi:MAG: hypothetical protein M1812_002170 [Candelaria pacifica]|nr:MAG: hypothetical protein M1812_002170 [Candelaria pacifica]
MAVSNPIIPRRLSFQTLRHLETSEDITSIDGKHDLELSSHDLVSGSLNDWPNDQGFEVSHEERSTVELNVTGKIPAYAAGTLYRTGPGGYQVRANDGTVLSRSHWFDGFSQMHRFQIVAPADTTSEIKVLYNSRRTVDKLVENIRRSGSFEGFSFGQKRDPCQSYFKKVMSAFTPEKTAPMADERNVGVTLSINMPGLAQSVPSGKTHASAINSIFTKTDASAFQQIDPETLEPIGLATQQSLNSDLKGPMSAAHAKSDPVTGDIFNYNLELGMKHLYRVFRVSASTGQTDILATIKTADAAYLHSLFLTENYVILCVWGSHYAKGGAMVLWEKNILDAIADFDYTKRTEWYVVDRKHGKGVVATYECDPFFCFHTINAWEQPSSTDASGIDIIADLTVYENLDVLKRFYYENLISTSPAARAYEGDKGDIARGVTKRFRLPSVTSASVMETRKADIVWTVPRASSAELPTLNPSYVTKPHRYTYGVVDRGYSTFVDGLVKLDTQTQLPLYWQEHGHSPGEAIFISNPKGELEDDGVLLSVVLDGPKGKSYLLCLDAKTMTEIGRASLKTAVGFGFHGSHFPALQNGPTLNF